MDRLVAADESFRSGWEAFDLQLQRKYPQDLAVLAERRAAWIAGSSGPTGLTHMNFMRLMTQEAGRLGFHWRRTGCDSSREAAMLFLGWLEELPCWHAHAPRNGWRSDLWTSDCAAGMALALDQLGPSIRPESLARSKAVLLERGVLPVLEEWVDPDKRIHALDSMGHNWWSVCVAGSAMGLFAVAGGRTDLDGWFDLIADGILEFFDYPGNVLQNKQRTFGADGDFIESVGYLDYTLHHLVVVFDLYRDLLGRDLAAEIEVLPRICDYYMACVQPLREGVRRLNFGDMGSGAETVGAYNHHPSSVWLWLARRFGREDLFHLVRRTHVRPTDVNDFLHWPEGLRGDSFDGAPGDVVFGNIGVAVLRDGYADHASVLAVKTGEKWNHNQSDAGSFILSADGAEFFIDPGTTGYSDPRHADYFKRSVAHNVVLHAGRGQLDDLDDLGTKHMGRIASSLLAPGYRHILADATGPWEGVYRRFYRSLLWIDGFIVMADELMAWEPGEWTALFHHAGEAVLRSDGFDVLSGGRTLRATFVDPLPERLDFAEGFLSHMLPNELKYEYEVTPKSYVRAHYAPSGPRAKLLTVFELPGQAFRKISRLAGAGFTGVVVEDTAGVWEIVLNHRADGSVMHLNSYIHCGDVTTDAYLYAVLRDRQGMIRRAAMHNGSYLRMAGSTIASSLLKGDIVLDFHPDRTVVTSAFSAVTNLSLRPPGGRPQRRKLSAGPSRTEIPR
jgi:hypothetical protein